MVYVNLRHVVTVMLRLECLVMGNERLKKALSDFRIEFQIRCSSIRANHLVSKSVPWVVFK